jgi:hypothetical protein
MTYLPVKQQRLSDSNLVCASSRRTDVGKIAIGGRNFLLSIAWQWSPWSRPT